MKIKMVRMVHRKGFYNTELTVCDGIKELWTKTDFLRRSKNSKFSFEAQYLSFDGLFKDKMILKYIIIHSAIIPVQFPIKFI